jgi:hypothetical protein
MAGLGELSARARVAVASCIAATAGMASGSCFASFGSTARSCIACAIVIAATCGKQAD